MKLNPSASLIMLAAAAALAGCASSVKLDEGAPVESRNPTAVSGGVAPTQGGRTGTTPQSQVATVNLTQSPAGASGLDRVVYFDFDSFVIKDEFKPIVEGQK